MFIFMRAVFVTGLALSMIGTLILRLAGHLFLPSAAASAWLALYLLGAVATFVAARAIFRRAGIPAAEWGAAASVLIAPTLVLDAFTALFFVRVFPQLDPGLSGAFAGWMLICCAGAVLGAWQNR